MTGLDTIVEQILNEARDQSAEILNKAKRQSEDIIAQAQKEAEKVKASSDSRIQHEKTGGKSRAKSSSELKKRQAILKAKQEIIGEMMDKAYADILALPDDEYFAMVTKMLEKYALPKAGSIVFQIRIRQDCHGDMQILWPGSQKPMAEALRFQMTLAI